VNCQNWKTGDGNDGVFTDALVDCPGGAESHHLGIDLGGFSKACAHGAFSQWHREGGVGYSWTYLVFGWFVPVFRGELGVGVLHLVITLVTFGLSQLIFPFLYNRQYMVRMLTDGWQLDATDLNYELAKHKLNIQGP
jgi:hypothetical protein